jgi:hypothetical protein
MEGGRSERSSRASGAQLCASVALTACACSQLWNSVDLRGRREDTHAIATCNRVACWRNLAAESVSSLATRASSYPKRPRTRWRRSASQSCGSSSQLGHHRPLDLVRCPDSSGQQPHPAALILSGNAPTTTDLRQHAVLHHACVTVIGEAEKVTHSFHCRNSLSLQGASHAPST